MTAKQARHTYWHGRCDACGKMTYASAPWQNMCPCGAGMADMLPPLVEGRPNRVRPLRRRRRAKG